jgi:TRAP-type C4-dicarboxylate transport system substrate-binding protein
MYMNVERGVLDGTFCNWDTYLSYRMYEVGSYLTHGPFNAGAMGLCMSPAIWDKLSPQDQDIIMSLSGREGSEKWSRETYDMAVQAAYDTAATEGFETIDYYFTSEQIQEWKDLNSEEVWGIWLEKAAAKAEKEGYSNPAARAQYILDATVDLVENYTP